MGGIFYQASGLLLRPLLWGAFRLRVEGVHHVPLRGPAILASNHLSYLDSFLIPVPLLRPVTWVSKREHFDVPLQRLFFERWGVIPLRRGGGDREAYERSLEVLRKGGLLGIHPEGTRSTDGKIHRGKTGAVRLSLASGAWIVPVGIRGTEIALPKGSTRPRFVPVTLRFGRPLDIASSGASPEDRSFLLKATEELMEAIRELSGQEPSDDFYSREENP